MTQDMFKFVSQQIQLLDNNMYKPLTVLKIGGVSMGSFLSK